MCMPTFITVFRCVTPNLEPVTVWLSVSRAQRGVCLCHTCNNCSQSHVNLLATVPPPPALRPTPPGLLRHAPHVSLKITKNWHMPRSRTRARSIAGGAALPSTKNTQLRLHTPYRCQPALDGSELKGGLFGGWGGKQLLSSLRALSAAAADAAAAAADTAAAQSSSP